jgi:hypothetical protein
MRYVTLPGGREDLRKNTGLRSSGVCATGKAAAATELAQLLLLLLLLLLLERRRWFCFLCFLSSLSFLLLRRFIASDPSKCECRDVAVKKGGCGE